MVKCGYCNKELNDNQSLRLVEDVFYHKYCLSEKVRKEREIELGETYPDLHEDLKDDNEIIDEMKASLKAYPEFSWFLVYAPGPEEAYEIEALKSKQDCIKVVENETDPHAIDWRRFWEAYFIIHDFKSYVVNTEITVKITVDE